MRSSCTRESGMPEVSVDTRDSSRTTVSRTTSYWLVFLLIGLVLIVSSLLLHHGAGSYGDSAHYFMTAEKTGLSCLTPHAPPLYPLVLKLPLLLGVNVRIAAVWVNVWMMLVTVVSLFVALRWQVNASAPLAFLITIIILFSYPFLIVQAAACTEPLYLFLHLAFTCSLIQYMRSHSLIPLVGMAFFSSMGVLTRFAGIALVPTAILIIERCHRHDMRKSLSRNFLYLALTSIPVGALVTYNMNRWGRMSSRSMSWHPIPLRSIGDGIDCIANQFIPYRCLSVVPMTVKVLALLLVVAWLVHLLRKGALKQGVEWVVITLTYGIIYFAFLLVSISLFDAFTSLGEGILLPLLFLLLPALIMACSCANGLSWLKWALGAYILSFTVWRGIELIDHCYNHGLYCSSVAWKQSPTYAAALINNPSRIYSNAPEAFYLLSGIEGVQSLPRLMDPTSFKPRTDYPELMQAMRDNVLTNYALVAIFYLKNDADNWAYYLPPLKTIKEMVPVEAVEFPDGLILIKDPSRLRY